MLTQMNLADKLEKNLPAHAVALIKQAVTLAGSKNLPLYLAGGIIRDLLLGQTNSTNDLDLVVEGDAIGLATLSAGISIAIEILCIEGQTSWRGAGFKQRPAKTSP